jgi:hypothetical protein
MDLCKPVPLGSSLAGNPVKPLMSLHGTEWRERGYPWWLWTQYIRFQILYNPTLEAEQQATTAVAHTDRDKNKRLSHDE